MINAEVSSDLSLYVGSTSRPSFVPKEIHFGRSISEQQRLENLRSGVATGPQVIRFNIGMGGSQVEAKI